MRKYQEANAGDIVLWDGEKKDVVEQGDYTVESFPEDKFTPIGVVVIPASHMDDGKARMMATRWMSCDDPENGSLEIQMMVWGAATDLIGLTKFTEVPIVSSDTNQVISGVNEFGYIPSNNSYFTGDSNPQDEGTRWYFTDNECYIASPYTSDGTPNPFYRATEYSGGSINNALSYFDGRHQTDVILAARGSKDYGSWNPTYKTPSDYPAASCCDMYHTVGTNQGDWYLPSIAELGYIVARLGSINDAMTKVNGMQKLSTYWAWSSSEYDLAYARYVNFEDGYVDSMPIGDGYFFPVVAFATI